MKAEETIYMLAGVGEGMMMLRTGAKALLGKAANRFGKTTPKTSRNINKNEVHGEFISPNSVNSIGTRPYNFNGFKFDINSSPLKVPQNATAQDQIKTGYTQVKFKWADEAYKYEARWHTRTPGAPINQGDTWGITRTTPETAQGIRKTEHILTGEEWTPMNVWQSAVTANKAGVETNAQLNLLAKGHFKAY